MGWIPGQGAKISHAMWQGQKEKKRKKNRQNYLDKERKMGMREKRYTQTERAYCFVRHIADDQLNVSSEYATGERNRKIQNAKITGVSPNPVVVNLPGKGWGEFLPLWLCMKTMGLVELNLSKQEVKGNADEPPRG